MKKNLPLILLIACNALCITAYSQSTAHSFTFGGQTRTYRVYLPVNFNSSTSLPLVLNLHGLNSNSQQQELLTQFDNLADTARCVVAYPDGISGQWNMIIAQSGNDDVGFISALIDTMKKNYNIDLGRVYATGMSMGGYMSFRLACELSCRIAAIASVTGLLQEAVTQCNPTRKMPVIQMHGTSDSTVPYSNSFPYASVASTLSRWKIIDGCPTPVVTAIPDINTSDGCTAEKYYYGLCGNSTELIHYKILGGEHSWPDGAVNLGVTNRDFNATSTIWNFFKKYSTAAGVTFTGLGSSYCYTASGVTLTGTPSGGTFSGTGISGSQFNPANATIGANNITYTITSLGCTYSTNQTTTVFSPSSASIIGLNQSYCTNAGVVNLSGTPSGGTFIGTGVSGGQFNPQTAGAGGPYTITYQGTSGGCSYSTNQSVTVSALPTVTLSGNPDTVCSNANAITLTGGTPVGGTYLGAGVTGNSFNPATAGVGAKVVTYSYTNGSGCTSSNTETIVVKSCITTGTNEDDVESAVTLYPNPAKDELILQSSLFTGKDIAPIIYDVAGRLYTIPVKQQGDKIILITGSLVAGSYSVNWMMAGKTIYRKFVKAD